MVLAYSGGLDTTVAVRWLSEKMGLDVVAVAVDVGQGSDLEAIRSRALATGAVEAQVVDARAEFASDFLAPSLKANALYQQKYPLVSALSRPLICRHLVAAARAGGARFVAHGCTGKGNDQVRFEVSVRALAPDLGILAPVREWGMSREETIEYGLDRSLPPRVVPGERPEPAVARVVERRGRPLVVEEHPVPRAKFPVGDIHSHTGPTPQTIEHFLSWNEHGQPIFMLDPGGEDRVQHVLVGIEEGVGGDPALAARLPPADGRHQALLRGTGGDVPGGVHRYPRDLGAHGPRPLETRPVPQRRYDARRHHGPLHSRAHAGCA